MEYNSTQIVQETGVTLRTIRLWAARKLVPPPRGRGRGTRYTEEHRFLIKVVKKMVTMVHDLAAVRIMLKEWTREQQAELIGEGAAEKPAVATEPPTAPSAPPPELPYTKGGAEIAKPGSGETPLPEGARWVIVGLLPNLALMIGEEAAPLVRRVAAEICREYGRG